MYAEAFQNKLDKQQEQIEIAEPKIWSGTGFALNDGYIVTNYHVIDNASKIKVSGINGNYTYLFDAFVYAKDINNDIAIIKVNDSKFKGFGSIPYDIKNTISDVGEEIFVLGYPLTASMGDEIKLTTGIVSSKTGFQGDVSLYQISAPIQPGSSGGPLFDHSGSIIGIVNSKHRGAENVGYAIKTSYLRNLIESTSSPSILPSKNIVSGQSLINKVKTLKNYVFIIECSNDNSSPTPSIIPTTNTTNKEIQTIYSCVYRTTNENKDCKISRVELAKNETIVYFNYNIPPQDDNTIPYITISPDTYISYNGKSYNLIGSNGIEYSPKRTRFYYPGKYEFSLKFSALPNNVEKFDLIEPGNSSWKFYDIKLEK